MEQPLVIGGKEIRRGARTDLEIPIGRLPAGTFLSLPVIVFHGRRPGPCLVIDAAIHGDEINGVEIILNLLGSLDARKLAGTVIAVPIVNVFGFVAQSRYLPDRRDLNRSFPGSATGSLAARLANVFVGEIGRHADCIVDMHTGSLHRANLPQIRAALDDARTLELSRAFGAPIILRAKPREGSLRKFAAARGVPCLVYEAGEPHRFDPDAVRVGTEGILRILGEMGIRPFDGPPPRAPIEIEMTKWVRARRSGILRPRVELGERVKARQIVGTISDTFGRKSIQVTSPFDGVILGMQLNPLVYRGDALFHVAAAER